MFLSSCRPSSPPTLQNNDEMKRKKDAFFISKTTEPRQTITRLSLSLNGRSSPSLSGHERRTRTVIRHCGCYPIVIIRSHVAIAYITYVEKHDVEKVRAVGEHDRRFGRQQQHKMTLTWSCITTNLNMTITTIMSLRGRTTPQVVT